jgi:pimeloyl-ACP methyl ester carboxylesterase
LQVSEFVLEPRSVNGTEIDVWTGGDGPTILFLHGAGGASPFFRPDGAAPFLRELAASFRVIVPEHPGYGHRERPEWLDSIHDLAYFYLDFMKALDLTDIHLAGSSLGGWVALEVAVRSTERLNSLTLCCAAGIHLKGVPKGDIFLWSPEQFAENCLMNEEVRAAYLAVQPTPEVELMRLRNQQTTALLAWEPRLYDPDLHKWLHRIDVPTHVVWADDDRILPKDYADAFAAMIDGAKVSIIARSGHLLHLDRPHEFSAAVGGFILEDAA